MSCSVVRKTKTINFKIMARLFDSVQFDRPKLNKFDLSHENKLSMNMGKLVPVLVQEVVPGDSFRVNTEVFVRVAPMLAPVMHRVDVKTEAFFVPTRLIWDEWEDFITGGRLGTSAPVAPIISLAEGEQTEFGNGSLADYMGIPDLASQTIDTVVEFSALPFRAYQLIYNEYYRDQNLQEPVDISKASGTSSDGQRAIICTLRDRAWEKDYYTSALPFAQRGGDVSLPIQGSSEDITYKTISEIKASGGGAVDNNDFLGTGNLDAEQLRSGHPTPEDGVTARIENIESFSFEATDITINVLRRAVMLQKWLEKMALGGARYVEQMRTMFGVVGDDARLQRPEFLGGGRSPVVISEVVSTFQADDGEVPQGNMAGHGLAVGRTHGFNRRFKEHGYVIMIMSVLPRTAYQDGLARMWRRITKYDYYWPDFAHLGEQEVLKGELFYDASTPVNNTALFGYQSRYCEYKYNQSSVHGEFRGTLDYWHMGRKVSEAVLNNDFVTSNPTHRIFPVTDPSVHKLYCQVFHKFDALRPMPYYGTPRL